MPELETYLPNVKGQAMTEAVKTIDQGGAAFPCDGGSESGLYADPGMSLRDWFAGQALAGMLAGVPGSHLIPTADKLGKEAYEAADALIAARKPSNTPAVSSELLNALIAGDNLLAQLGHSLPQIKAIIAKAGAQ